MFEFDYLSLGEFLLIKSHIYKLIDNNEVNLHTI
jgi:hypothetical protein